MVILGTNTTRSKSEYKTWGREGGSPSSVLSLLTNFGHSTHILLPYPRMHAFSRLATFLIFVLSLSIFTYALPASGTSGALSTRDQKCQSLIDVLVDLKSNVDTCISTIVKADASADVVVQLDLMVGHVEASALSIKEIGSITDIDAVVKADFAARIAAIIVVLKACLKLSLKFGIQVLVGVFVKIDAAVKLLLTNVGACVDGIVVLTSQIVMSTCGHIIVDLNFRLVAGVLATVGITLN
ncbi:hypothetical protein AG1IA_00676 [Rhizoctonia solani AG-1 IA]|uniref:Transmembrane protein n=1 Tax=Thanatephorus cucumeris (strain AG1-IA) TaxID=983506 RepID=L8X541_THACA|nr:hypothetical protein AG1IA_00676 [Rhizoctonia solani AG-1 IA]